MLTSVGTPLLRTVLREGVLIICAKICDCMVAFKFVYEDMDPAAPSERLRTEKVIKKIPGNLPPVSSCDKEAYIGNLSQRSTADLKELLERQDKILSNKFIVSKLKDKGAKAAELKQKIEEELKSRGDVEIAANLLAGMSLGQLNALEWSGHCSPGYWNVSSSNKEDDPESADSDPLKIIATHSGVTSHQKQTRILKPEASLITPKDLAQIEDNSRDAQSRSEVQPAATSSASCQSLLQSASHLHDNPEPFAQYICNRYGHTENKERFKPNKPLKPFTGVFPMQPSGRISSKINRFEETNVTPPMPIFGDSKLVTLEESIELQQQQAQKLKEVQMKHTAERLLSMQGLSLVGELPSGIISSMSYRRPLEMDSDSDDDVNEANIEDQEEVHDEDQRDRDAAVVYSVMA